MAGEPDSVVVAVTLRVVRVLEEFGVPYVVGGSLASSVHGTMRSTADVDLVVDLRAEHVPPFVRALGDEFYVSENRVAGAVEAGGSFNIIAIEPMFNVDLFVATVRTARLRAQARTRARRCRLGRPARVSRSNPHPHFAVGCPSEQPRNI